MKVEAHGNDSPQWKEILKGRDIIEKGRCMIIGNGEKTNIWLDPWIPTIPDFKAFPKDPDNIKCHHVNDFICDSKWNEQCLMDQFEAPVADEIRKISIGNKDSDDFCSWILDKQGTFSVRSAYKIIHSAHQTTHLSFDSSFWKKLWKIKASHRTKILIWRISQAAIPTRDILKIRMNWIEGECLLCNEEDETRVHCFFNCYFARLIWSRTMGLRTEAHPNWNIAQWLEACVYPEENLGISRDMASTTQTKMCLIIDALWKERNHCLHNKCQANPSTVLTNLESINSDVALIMSQPLVHTDTMPVARQAHRERQMQQSSFTFHTDAAVRSRMSYCAWVNIGPDNTVTQVEVQTIPTTDLAAVECQAILTAVRFNDSSSLTGAHIFTDAKEIVDDLSKGKPFPWRRVSQMEEIDRLAAKNTTILFTPREHNYLAHTCAKWAAARDFVRHLTYEKLPGIFEPPAM